MLLTNKNLLTGRKRPVSQTDQETKAGLDLCTRLSKLQFWCGDDTLHTKDTDYQKTAGCCTTHVIGLPRHAATNEEMPLTPFQVEFANIIINGRDGFGTTEKERMRKPLMVHLNKGRQMGFTEIVLRLIVHFSFSRYAGSNIAIVTGNNGSLANENLRRLARLYKSIPSVVKQWIKAPREGVHMILVNDATTWAYSTNDEAITGRTKYKCIFMDEAAKWLKVDDTPVFNAIVPIVRTNGSDFFVVSTPKGKVKMFYKISMDPQDFILLQYDIWETKGNMYTEEQIKTMLATSTEDPDQEYLCKYTSGRASVYGIVTKESMQGPEEWVIDEYDKEGDSDGIYYHKS